MTDRYFTLTVLLDHDHRSDDAEDIINAIKMIRGVADVTGNVTDTNTFIAISTAKRELQQKLIDVLR